MAIRSESTRVRQIMLRLVALIAVAHANLSADLTGRMPNAAGMMQLGRDIVRKSLGEVADQRVVAEKSRNTIG